MEGYQGRWPDGLGQSWSAGGAGDHLAHSSPSALPPCGKPVIGSIKDVSNTPLLYGKEGGGS